MRVLLGTWPRGLGLSPLEFFENKNFDPSAPVRAERAPKLWIWTSKIMPDLWLVDLFCPIKKNSTLHPTIHYTNIGSIQYSTIFNKHIPAVRVYTIAPTNSRYIGK